MSHRKTSVLDDDLIHSFVIFKDVQVRLALRNICVCGHAIHLWHSINIQVPLLVWFGLGLSRTFACCFMGPHPINQEPVFSQTSIQRYDFWFCRTVGYWRLFLANPAKKDKCSTPKDTQDYSRRWYWILKVASKVWFLEETQSTMLCTVTHMTILFEFTFVMNVWNQTSYTFVTSSCPFGDWSSYFVRWPKNVWSTTSSQIQAFLRQFVSILLTILQLIQVPLS